jgi:segregation and condensation protein A
MDVWGKEVARFPGNLAGINEEQVRDALKAFSGEIEQVPSMYSAIKKDGVPLYKLARKGIETEVEARKVNIYDIPIVEITAQYLEYVHAMEEANLDTISDFLVMAATLLDIKCRMLLPKEINEDGEEEDPRSELVERLLEYKMYKYASQDLKDRQLEAARALYKAPTIPPEVASYEEPIDINELLADVTLSRLQKVFDFVMKRREDKVDPVRSKFGRIKKEPIKVEDKILAVMAYGMEHRIFDFKELLERQPTRMEIVVTFLAVLELLKMGRLQVTQEELFDEIQLELVDDTPVVFETLTEQREEA